MQWKDWQFLFSFKNTSEYRNTKGCEWCFTLTSTVWHYKSLHQHQTLNAPSMSKCAGHIESIIWGVKHLETCLWMLKEAQTIVALGGRSSTDWRSKASCSCPLLEMPVRSGCLFVHFCRSSLNQLLPLRFAICCL